jgi:hypothetical protein
MNHQTVYDIYGLREHKLYTIPACSVSYSPHLAGKRGFWTGKVKSLPVGGGTMAEFALTDGTYYWLRPWAVVEA